MGRQMPWDDIPDSNVFATGDYHMQGVKMEETHSQSTGKLMYAIDVQVMEHPNTAAYTNMHFFENFVIGTDDDPDAQVSGTWVQSVGAKRLKQLINAANIQERADMDKICAAFAGCQLVIGLQAYKEPETNRDGSPNAYAGQERNKSVGFYKLGSREPKVELKLVKGPAGQVAAPPATPAPPAQAPPVAAAPPAPPQAAAPPAPPAQAPPTAAPAAGGQVLTCQLCQAQVPAMEYAAHFSQCVASQGQTPAPQG